MYEYDGQVVKVIIYSRRNGHFPVMVLHTLNKVCMENITFFFFIFYYGIQQGLCPFHQFDIQCFWNLKEKYFVCIYMDKISLFSSLTLYRDHLTMHHTL